jgi:hypothetical protein
MRATPLIAILSSALLASSVVRADEPAMVEIRGDFGLRLQLRDHDDEWIDVCAIPCRIRPVAQLYRIESRSISTSSAFTIPRGAASVDVDASPLYVKVLGTVLTSVGGATILGGSTPFLMSSMCEDSPDRCGPTQSQKNVAYGVMLAGAATLVTGLVLLANRHTTVRIDEPVGAIGSWVTVARDGSLRF